ncbi:SDR family oxidoreductase [Streptomyces sp. NPDC093970]|uniref:SDR family NAD(P)-dependent oxidoreductase n=1 Tax=Streptomyces sp. NPDC093970 TaxID=3155076 RepID=UPI0034431A51
MSTSTTALVTGSTSGIGAAVARALAATGFHVLVTGRSRERGAAVVADIARHQGAAVFLPSELERRPAELRRFAESATDALGGHVDVLVHCAAVCPAVDTPALTDEDLDAALAVNVRAPHVLTAALAPGMAERGRGAIVVIGSWMAGVGSPFVGLYSATKAAEIQLARSWAAEFGPSGVRVNTVSPGVTRAPEEALSEQAVRSLVAGIPARRAGTPDEVAATVAWLVSDAAAYVHGAEIPVDGGISSTRLH